jgi:hypothetical protein
MKPARLSLILAAFGVLAGCAVVPDAPGPQLSFFERLRALCGNAYQGRLVSSDSADRDIASSRLVMHVRTCSAHELRIPFHVGDDHSRTWVVSRTPEALRLKHDHRHQDGSEDVLTQYGGDTMAVGSSRRQEFPADPYSRDLFRREGNPASVDNVWAMEIVPGQMFAYELRRPNRHFRVEFDLTRPVTPPPPPWGDR